MEGCKVGLYVGLMVGVFETGAKVGIWVCVGDEDGCLFIIFYD